MNFQDIVKARLKLEELLGLAKGEFADAKQSGDLAKQHRVSKVRGHLYSALYYINQLTPEDLS